MGMLFFTTTLYQSLWGSAPTDKEIRRDIRDLDVGGLDNMTVPTNATWPGSRIRSSMSDDQWIQPMMQNITLHVDATDAEMESFNSNTTLHALVDEALKAGILAILDEQTHHSIHNEKDIEIIRSHIDLDSDLDAPDDILADDDDDDDDIVDTTRRLQYRSDGRSMVVNYKVNVRQNSVNSVRRAMNARRDGTIGIYDGAAAERLRIALLNFPPYQPRGRVTTSRVILSEWERSRRALMGRTGASMLSLPSTTDRLFSLVMVASSAFTLLGVVAWISLAVYPRLQIFIGKHMPLRRDSQDACAREEESTFWGP
eukprot:GEMP01066886.1.p1 GENE.GEMP01066886.1~~GEMP01066886.1.p1  ORF type:complete len:328 (+),score=62.17 GEMP01066886.1:46-984(+)